MKKVLLIFNILTTIAIFSASAADLNPFAYGLKQTTPNDKDAITRLCFSLNAQANAVKVVIIDEDENDYVLRSYGTTAIGDYGTDVTLADVVEKGIPFGQNLKWRVDVTGPNRGSTKTEYVAKQSLRVPMSMDIDNNPESPYFGRILVAQPTNASGLNTGTQGLYRYSPIFYNEEKRFDGKYKTYLEKITGGQTFTDNTGWYSGADGPCASPFRVRIAQDGTGRVFVIGFDINKDNYLWYVDPANLNSNWTSVLTKTSIVDLVNPDNGVVNLFAASMDIMVDADKIDLLLMSQTLGKGTFYGGQFYSGIYSIPSSFNKANINQGAVYTPLTRHLLHHTTNSKGDDVCYIPTGSANSFSVSFDQNGDVWYAGSKTSSSSALVHKYGRNLAAETGAEWKNDYHTNDDALQAKNSVAGGFRYNRTFDKVAIARGTTYDAAIYTVAHGAKGTSHPTLELWTTINDIAIPSSSSTRISDFAWDYANNLYVCVSNATEVYGIYAYATNLNGTNPVSTPATSTFVVDRPSEGYYDIRVETSDANKGTVEGGGDLIPAYQSVEVLAKSKDGYKFVSWKDNAGNVVSTSNPYTFSVTKNVTLTAYFEAGSYNVTWWNLFKDGEDIYDAEIDTKRNARLYYLFMAYYNAGSGAGLRWAAKLDDGSGEYNLGNSCYTYTDELLNKDKNAPMYWLGEYLKSVVGDSYSLQVGDAENISVQWGKCMFAFINKVGYAKDYQGKNISVPQALVTAIKAFAPVSSGGEGKGEYTEWRPWWTNLSCELPNSLKYNNALPVTWTMQSAPYNTYDTYANNTVPGNYQPNKTPKWYQWNTAPKNDQLLAWRSGSETGKIVHHITQDNMALYATYVDKALQEDDPTPTGDYDATNNDVLDLLANDNHGSTPHNVTVDRKFAGGMYNTVCFPFDLPITSLPVELRDADILAFTGVTKTGDEFGDPVAILNFIPLADYWQLRDNPPAVPYMEAGVPYLIKPKNDVNNASLTYTNLLQWRFFDSKDTPLEEGVGDVTFQGVLNPTTLPENAYILVANDRLAKVTDTSEKIKGYRGYFVINDIMLRTLADQGNVYFSFRKPVTTSVPVAPESEQQHKPEVRKIMYDGKIYILRGNEVYTITGHRVK